MNATCPPPLVQRTGERLLTNAEPPSEAPLVSVVVPAHNAAETLEATLLSASAQTHRNLEILVIDDGSTDRTAAIAEDIAARDPRISLLSQPNRGVAAARNLGLSRARGEFVAPLDADDLWHPTKIEKQLAAFLAPRATDVGFVYTFARIVDPRGRVVHSRWPDICRGDVLYRHILLNFVSNGSSILFRRDAAQELGGYNVRLREKGLEGCEDWDLQLRLAERYAVEVVPEYLVGYRSHPRQMSRQRDRMLRSSLHVALDVLAAQRTVPPGLVSWTIGLRHARLWLVEFRAGRPLDAVRTLARALRHDPAITVLDAMEKAKLVVARCAACLPWFRPRLARFEDLSPRLRAEQLSPSLYVRLMTHRLDALAQAADRHPRLSSLPRAALITSK